MSRDTKQVREQGYLRKSIPDGMYRGSEAGACLGRAEPSKELMMCLTRRGLEWMRPRASGGTDHCDLIGEGEDFGFYSEMRKH